MLISYSLFRMLRLTNTIQASKLDYTSYMYSRVTKKKKYIILVEDISITAEGTYPCSP